MEERLDLIEKAEAMGIAKAISIKYGLSLYKVGINDLRFEVENAQEEEYLRASLSKSGIVY